MCLIVLSALQGDNPFAIQLNKIVQVKLSLCLTKHYAMKTQEAVDV
jgi:hypothetical protein